MSYVLNDKIKNLTPYEPITGKYDIRLDANESFITLPPDIMEKALRITMSSQSNRYPDPNSAGVIRAFSELYGVNKENITAGNGSDELISIIVGSFFTQTDLLVTLSEDFSMYKFYADLYGVATKVYQKKENLRIDIDGLISYINETNARGVIFSNPCNPTSLIEDKKLILKLAKSVNALVVVDEAYMDFADESVLEYVNKYDNLIILKTCSKAIGMASLRLGFAVSNKKITKVLRACKSPYNVNTLTQNIGEIVLSDGEYVLDSIRKIIRSRDHLYNAIMGLHVKYNGFDRVYETSTNFVFIKTKHAKKIYEKLLEKSIAIRYMGNYIRITAGTKKENETLIHELEAILKEMEK